MKSGKIVLIGVLVVFFLIGIWFVGSRNSLVTLNEEVNFQLSNVGTTLQRRSDLIPNLVETVKGYAKHEEQVFTDIADARAKLAGSIKSGDVESMNEANNALDSALSRLLAITENYPDLEASEQFIGLQDELAGTENRITVARQNYNQAVNKYNTAIKKFPANIIASMSGFEAADYFEVDESAKEVPKVSFD